MSPLTMVKIDQTSEARRRGGGGDFEDCIVVCSKVILKTTLNPFLDPKSIHSREQPKRTKTDSLRTNSTNTSREMYDLGSVYNRANFVLVVNDSVGCLCPADCGFRR